jgi:hypothetical protein
VTRLFLVLLLVQAATQPPAPAPARQPPGNATPGAPFGQPAPSSADPAAVTFTSDIGMLLVAVKAGAVADYEAAITALQEALSKSEDEETRTLARSWRVLKAAEADAKANALYIHLLEPPVPSADYRPSLWLDKLLAGAPPDLLAKYRDAFAVPPTKLGLVEFANMAVAPIAKPANASPDAPTVPAPPGNISPAAPGNRSPATPGNVSPGKPGNLSPVKPPAPATSSARRQNDTFAPA